MNEVGPHVRGAFPWLRSGPLWRMHVDAASALDAFLVEHEFLRLDLDGSKVTSRAAAHAELARLLGFPDWYGGNWDAFHDCFYGFVDRHAGERIAVVWHHPEVSAALAPLTAIEVGWALLTEAFEHRWSEQGRPTIWMETFALGDGDDFDRASGPDPGT